MGEMRARGTPRRRGNPRRPRQTTLGYEPEDLHGRLNAETLCSRRVHDLALVSEERPRRHFVREVEVEGAVLHDVLEQSQDVSGEEETRVRRKRSGQVRMSDDEHTMLANILSLFGELAVSALFHRQIHDHGAGL